MTYRWDDFELDIDGHRLTGPDGNIHVEPQVFGVLALLIDERARVVPKAEILDTVWGDQFVSESALTTRIKQARQALGDDGRTQRYIRNVHGRGYQFVGTLDDATDQAEHDGERQSESDGTSGAAPAARVPVRLALDIAVDDEFEFVGRQGELERADAIIAADAGGGGQVFIGGPAGAGKSRLAIEVLDRAAQRGVSVCAGRCEESVTSSLQAVRDAFGQLALSNPEQLATWTAGVEGQILSLIPSLVGQLGADVKPVPIDAYAGIDVMVEVFCRAGADNALVVLIDDLQWSDDATLTFVDRLMRRVHSMPVFVVATFRSGRADLPDDVHRWLQRHGRSDNVVRFDLEDLDETAALDLIRSVVEKGGDAGSAGSAAATSADAGTDWSVIEAQLLATTAGNCLFLTESLREVAVGREAAASVADLILGRLGRQDSEVQQVVRAGAALGPEFPFSVAASAAGLDAGSALAAIDTAVEAGLLHQAASSSRFRFSHQLVPHAIVEELSRAERAKIHASCAAALSGEGGDDVEVAFHKLAAVPIVDLGEAVEEAREAAGSARRANQFDRALRLLERVLTAEPSARVRAEVQLEMGEIINAKGMPGTAIAHLEAVAESARKNGWQDLFVAAALQHWSQSPFRKLFDRSTLDLLAEADQWLGDEPSVAKAQVMAKTAVFEVMIKTLRDRDQATAEAIAMAEACDADDGVRLRLLEARLITFTCPAGGTELDALGPEIERLRLERNDYFADAAAPETGAYLAARGDDLRRVSSGDDDRISSQPIAEWRDLVLRGTFATLEGEFDEARALCDSAREIGEQFWGDSSHALHGYSHFIIDLLTDSWDHSPEALEFLRAMNGPGVFDGAVGLTRFHAGNEAGAREVVDQIDSRWLKRFGEHIVGGNALTASAELALVLDDDDLADRVEKRLLKLSDVMLGLPWASGLAAPDLLARLAARRGDDEAAERYRSTALDMYDRMGAPAFAERLTRLL